MSSSVPSTSSGRRPAPPRITTTPPRPRAASAPRPRVPAWTAAPRLCPEAEPGSRSTAAARTTDLFDIRSAHLMEVHVTLRERDRAARRLEVLLDGAREIPPGGPVVGGAHPWPHDQV